jgi:hypothetical protein
MFDDKRKSGTDFFTLLVVACYFSTLSDTFSQRVRVGFSCWVRQVMCTVMARSAFRKLSMQFRRMRQSVTCLTLRHYLVFDLVAHGTNKFLVFEFARRQQAIGLFVACSTKLGRSFKVVGDSG